MLGAPAQNRPNAKPVSSMSHRVARVLSIGLRRKRYLSAILAWVVLVNAPFVLGHPSWGMLGSGVARSLAVSLVLFVVPGLSCIGPRYGAAWRSWLILLQVVAVSFLVFFGLLVLFHIVNRPLAAAAMWNGTWMISNLLIVVRLFTRGPVSWRIAGPVWTSIATLGLFAGSYGLYYFGASRVVPVQHDHDIDTQGPAYGLLNRFEPLMVTDRETPYYFAHPLLFHFYVGGSFLYYDEMAHLEVFDQISRRYRSSIRGEPFELPREPVVTGYFPNEVFHRIVGTEGPNYLVDPPFPDGDRRMNLLAYELQAHFSHYSTSPHFVENRTPSIFLAALTVAMLCQWSARISGRVWMGLLAGLAYATSPEVFVRSSYGGFFSISNFSLMMMLLADAEWVANSGRMSRCSAVLAGAYAALGNHKVMLFPASLVLYRVGTSIVRREWRDVPRAALNPVAVGFVIGTALFWLHGAYVDWQVFWVDHVMSHVVDRLVHEDRLQYMGKIPYPSAAGLWQEFCEHSGYVLLPVGLLSLVWGLWKGTAGRTNARTEPNLRVMAVWTAVTAVAFSLTDWRQTKHLMPLMIPLHLAPVCLTAKRPMLKAAVAVIFAGLVVWNIGEIRELAADFASYPITPDW